MSRDPEMPDGGPRRHTLDYRKPEPRSARWSIGTGCLIAVVIVVVIVGVIFGTCMMR